jgi:predicted phage terminase large subunit-like protein
MSFKAREFKVELTQLALALQLQIETDVAGFDADPQASAERRSQAFSSFRFFVRTYFPHYATAAPSVMHEWLFDFLPSAINQPEGLRAAISAPRGEAKSTIITQLFSLWCVLTGRKHYIIIVMDTYEQAAEMLEEMKAELAFNARLAMDFPEASGQGHVWREGVCVSRNNVKIKAFGSGKKMRGQRHGPHRPDLVIGDDLENDENVNSPTQRDKLEKWLKKTVLSLGAADGSMDAIIVGTVIHYDSLLARLLRNKLWQTKVFRSILVWPTNMDLWDQWEALLLNEGRELAKAFYQQRINEMNAGAVVSWPALRDLYALMLKRATDGHGAFDSEQQNDPSAGDAAPLASSIKVFSGITPSPHWTWFGAVDPSLGKAGASRDPSAILVGAFDRVTRKLYVYKAPIKKRLPSLIISDVIAAQKEHNCILWGVEAVQFQEFLRTEIIRQSLDAGVPVPARAIIPHADKLLRIESLQPFMESGNILIHTSCVTLIEQLKHFPLGDHDDGPDALQMLWMLASTSVGTVEFYAAGDIDRLEGRGEYAHDDGERHRSDY